FYALSTKDLSDVKRVFVNARGGFVPVSSRTLFVSGEQGQIAAFNLPELTTADGPPGGGFASAFLNGFNPQGRRTPVRIGDMWLFEGAIFNSDMSKLRMMVFPQGIPSLVGAAMPNVMEFFGQQANPSPWGVDAVG